MTDMIGAVLTTETLLQEIHLAEVALHQFEQQHALSSEIFYERYVQGQLLDEDPVKIQSYLVWSGWWEIYQNRRQQYAQLVNGTPLDKPRGAVAPIYRLHEYAEDLGVTDLAQNLDHYLYGHKTQ